MSKSVVSRSSVAHGECIGSSAPELRQISLGSHATRAQRAVSTSTSRATAWTGYDSATGPVKRTATRRPSRRSPATSRRRPSPSGAQTTVARCGAHHGAVVDAGDVRIGHDKEGHRAVGRRRELLEPAGDVGGGGRRCPTAARITADPPTRPCDGDERQHHESDRSRKRRTRVSHRRSLPGRCRARRRQSGETHGGGWKFDPGSPERRSDTPPGPEASTRPWG